MSVHGCYCCCTANKLIKVALNAWKTAYFETYAGCVSCWTALLCCETDGGTVKQLLVGQ